MKQLMILSMLVMSAFLATAQDIITLKSGETIQGKVTEVGISEVKYYKADNLQGPVYVLSKADIAQVLYQNKTVDVFNNAVPYYNGNNKPNSPVNNQQPNVVIVEQPVPQTIIVQRPYYRYYAPAYLLGHGLFDAHISLGSHHGYSGGYHNGHH